MHHFIFCTVIPAADLCILQHMSNFLTLSKSALLKVVNPPFTGSVSEHPAIGEVFESISSSFSDNFIFKKSFSRINVMKRLCWVLFLTEVLILILVLMIVLVLILTRPLQLAACPH